MTEQHWTAQAALYAIPRPEGLLEPEPWQREVLDRDAEPGRSLFVAPRRASGAKLHAAVEDLQRLAPRGPVFTPEQVEAITEAARTMGEVMRGFCEQLARTFADAEPILRNVLGTWPVEDEPPADPRERALAAKRARGTGPARPRLDGRRGR